MVPRERERERAFLKFFSRFRSVGGNMSSHLACIQNDILTLQVEMESDHHLGCACQDDLFSAYAVPALKVSLQCVPPCVAKACAVRSVLARVTRW